MLETIFKRRSIRKYQDKEVSDQDIKTLLEAAMAAPSARNKQPWEFIVIKNKDIQNQIKSYSAAYNYNSPLLILVCGNKHRCNTDKVNDYFIQDGSAAIQNILLAAVSLGLGTCWCGVNPIEERMEFISNILQLEEHIIPLGIIHVGHPAEEKPAHTKYNEEYIKIIK